jgi:hypothetical protein
MTPNQTVIDALECSGVALEQAERYYQSKEAEAREAHARVQPAVEACLSAKLVLEQDTAKLASALSNPVTALEWLTKVARYVADNLNAQVQPMGGSDAPVNLGKAGTAKRASTSPFAGRRSSRLRESDIQLFKNLGLPVPTE